jgi:hypothetical protein
MFSSTISSFGPSRRVAGGLTAAMLIAAMFVFAVVALALNTRTAVGAVGGGGCFSTTGPVCTFKSHVAFADFGSVSADGCIFTDAFVGRNENLSSPGHVATTSVFVAVSKFNGCTNTLIENATNIDPATGPVFNGTAQFDTKLDTATVNGSAPMFDTGTGAQLFTSTINVAWHGFGPTSTFIDSSHFRSPGFLLNSHFRGTSRAAEASGVVTDETASNLATLPTLNASLENALSGTVQLSHS